MMRKVMQIILMVLGFCHVQSQQDLCQQGGPLLFLGRIVLVALGVCSIHSQIPVDFCENEGDVVFYENKDFKGRRIVVNVLDSVPEELVSFSSGYGVSSVRWNVPPNRVVTLLEFFIPGSDPRGMRVVDLIGYGKISNLRRSGFNDALSAFVVYDNNIWELGFIVVFEKEYLRGASKTIFLANYEKDTLVSMEDWWFHNRVLSMRTFLPDHIEMVFYENSDGSGGEFHTNRTVGDVHNMDEYGLGKRISSFLWTADKSRKGDDMSPGGSVVESLAPSSAPTNAELISAGFWDFIGSGSVAGGNSFTFSLERAFMTEVSYTNEEEYVQEVSREIEQGSFFETRTTKGWTLGISKDVRLFNFGLNTELSGEFTSEYGSGTSASIAVTTASASSMSNAVQNSAGKSEGESCTQECTGNGGDITAYGYRWVHTLRNKATGETVLRSNTCQYWCTYKSDSPPLCPPDQCLDRECLRCQPGTFANSTVDAVASSAVTSSPDPGRQLREKENSDGEFVCGNVVSPISETFSSANKDQLSPKYFWCLICVGVWSLFL